MRRHDGKRVAAHARQREQVGLQAGAAGGIGGGEREDCGKRGNGFVHGENARRCEGLHLKPGLGCARQPGVDTIVSGVRARSSHSTQPHSAFAYAFVSARRHRGLTRRGVASPAATSTTKPKDGRKTASSRARAGRTFRPAGAARSAARARKISRWWSSECACTAPMSDNASETGLEVAYLAVVLVRTKGIT